MNSDYILTLKTFTIIQTIFITGPSQYHCLWVSGSQGSSSQPVVLLLATALSSSSRSQIYTLSVLKYVDTIYCFSTIYLLLYKIMQKLLCMYCFCNIIYYVLINCDWYSYTAEIFHGFDDNSIIILIISLCLLNVWSVSYSHDFIFSVMIVGWVPVSCQREKKKCPNSGNVRAIKVIETSVCMCVCM